MATDLDRSRKNWSRNGHESEGVFRGFCKPQKTPFSYVKTEGYKCRVNLQKLAMYRTLKLVSGNSQNAEFSNLINVLEKSS